MKTPIYSGIITNYNCTASCRHCMFASSPTCEKSYITPEMSENIAVILEEANTESVHIGGGEPFMKFDSLCVLIEKLNLHRIGIDYIETNAFWSSDENTVKRRLNKLAELGVSTVMVSVDPFHLEYIPLERPLKLCEMLQQNGFDYFVWQQRFIKRLLALDTSKTHSKDEIASVLGQNYITETAAEYGLGMNGRALAIAKETYHKKPAEMWATDEKCRSLTVPNHCHLDLYGNAVPSRCTGLCAEARDYLNTELSEEKYPVFSRLVSGGTAKLYEYSLEMGFVPDKNGYPTRCAFCYAMREYLERTHQSRDLAPSSYYNEMRKTV